MANKQEPYSTVHFDWLTAVIPIPEDCYSVFNYAMSIARKFHFSVNEINKSKLKGLYSYPYACFLSDSEIAIAWCDEDAKNDSRTMMIQLSGRGVAAMEKTFYNHGLTIADFVKDVIYYGGNFSRVDACLNLFNSDDEYSPLSVYEECKYKRTLCGQYRCNWVESFNANGEYDFGTTIYIGKNPKQLRIYDKKAERSQKVNKAYDVDNWYRWEFQLNGDFAKTFVENYLVNDCNLIITWKNWLVSNYRFIEKVGFQKKKSRYPTATWFSKLCDGFDNNLVLVRSENQTPTLKRTSDWINRQVSQSLANVVAVKAAKFVQNGFDEDDAIEHAKLAVFDDFVVDKLNDVDSSLIIQWLEENDS